MEKLRKDMNPDFCWDLSHIYTDQNAWEQAIEAAAGMVAEIPAIAGTLGSSADGLKDGLDRLFAAAEATERVYVYTMLNSSGDNGDALAQEMEERATRLYVDFSTASAFLNPEILAIDPEKLDQWLRLPQLAPYRHLLEDVCRACAHTLGEAEERLLAMLGDAAQTPKKAFDMFESVDMQFESLRGDLPLTHALFGNYREHRDPNVRSEAFEKYFGQFKKYGNTLAALYGGSVKFDSYFARVHHYASALEAGLFADNVPVALYDNLIACVRSSIPVMERYLELRRKLMGLEKLSL